MLPIRPILSLWILKASIIQTPWKLVNAPRSVCLLIAEAHLRKFLHEFSNWSQSQCGVINGANPNVGSYWCRSQCGVLIIYWYSIISECDSNSWKLVNATLEQTPTWEWSMISVHDGEDRCCAHHIKIKSSRWFKWCQIRANPNVGFWAHLHF